MAKALNRVTLLGNLGQNPEMRSTAQGSSVCTLNIATTENYKDKSGEWQEVTDWHRVVLWDRLADVAGQYLSKGSRVYIEGRLKTRSYEKDGTTRYITEVVCQNLIMLDSRGGSSSDTGRTQSQGSDIAQDLPDSPQQQPEDEDDEVPF